MLVKDWMFCEKMWLMSESLRRNLSYDIIRMVNYYGIFHKFKFAQRTLSLSLYISNISSTPPDKSKKKRRRVHEER